MGPMASVYQAPHYQAHIEADHCESALLTDQQKEQFLIKAGFVGLPLPRCGIMSQRSVKYLTLSPDIAPQSSA